MTPRFTKIISMTAVCAVLAISSGCELARQQGKLSPIDSITGMAKDYEARLGRVGEETLKSGDPKDAVVFYEKLYERKSRDPEVALDYAIALRKSGDAQRALYVLSPFVKGKKVDPIMSVEYGADNLQLGRMEQARETALLLLEDKKAEALHPYARNILGVTLDAEDKHAEAQAEYNRALENWQGDTTAVMNNLALSLASQGKFDDALTTLRQAQVMAPKREDLARNIEIVGKLRDSVVTKPIALKKKKKK